MGRARRIRKKVHRIYLDYVVGDVGTSAEWHHRLLDGEPAEACLITSGPTKFSDRHIKRWSLRYWVCVADRLDDKMAVLRFWADEFPEVSQESVIFRPEN